MRQPWRERLTIGGVLLVLAWIVVGALDVRGNGIDWKIFYAAGAAAGSRELLSRVHFVYLPGAAWFLWPFAHLSQAAGYCAFVVILILLTALAANLAAQCYGVSFGIAFLMALAWAPFTIAVCQGQNSPVALALVMLAVYGIARNDERLAGIGTGLLLYKPSDAVALFFLLLLLRAWRSLAIVAASAAGWYLLSALAAADWLWPVSYLQTLSALYRSDIALNADLAISIPTLLTRIGAPGLVAWAAGFALLLASAPFLLRVSRLEAASIVPLIGVAASPHAWGYEAILALPAMWFAVSRASASGVAAIVAAYAIAPVYIFGRQLHFNVLAIPVLGGVAVWMWLQARQRAPARRSA